MVSKREEIERGKDTACWGGVWEGSSEESLIEKGRRKAT